MEAKLYVFRNEVVDHLKFHKLNKLLSFFDKKTLPINHFDFLGTLKQEISVYMCKYLRYLRTLLQGYYFLETSELNVLLNKNFAFKFSVFGTLYVGQLVLLENIS